MKLLLLSDLHLSSDKNPIGRLDILYKTQFEKLEFILEYAADNNAIILQAGDFFNTHRNWYLLSDFITILNKYPVETYAIYGQHDVRMYSKELRPYTNLGILERADFITILNEKPLLPTLCSNINLYGLSWGEEIPKIIDKNNFNILVCHKDISNTPLFPGHKYTKASKFLKENDFDLILCGDIHQSFFIEKDNKTLINTGPLLRREATEYNLTHKPNFWVYDTNLKGYENIVIPHKPASNVLSKIHIENKNEKKEVLKEFIEEINNKQNDKKEKIDFIEILNLFIRNNDISEDVIKYLDKIMVD